MNVVHTAILGGALAAFSVAASAEGAVGMAELNALISGNTVHAQTLSNGQAFLSYFAASGKIVVQRDDAMEFSGYWSIRPDGSLCVSFSTEACGTIAKNADGSHTRNVGSVPTYRWSRITSGKGF
jgi:hypothetical protein